MVWWKREHIWFLAYPLLVLEEKITFLGILFRVSTDVLFWKENEEVKTLSMKIPSV